MIAIYSITLQIPNRRYNTIINFFNNLSLNTKKININKMETLIFTGTLKETKNSYTINENLPLIFGTTKPIIKKIIFGIEIKKPTSYKVYKSENSIRRVWCFNNVELNPSRYNLDQISNNNK